MKIGFGCYKLSQPEKDVEDALEAGYRYFDTAAIYETEEAVGNALKKSGIPRDEIQVASKCWIYDMGYEEAKAAFERSLEKLKLDYLDTYLIHWPRRVDDENWKDTLRNTWKAFEELKEEGLIKRIGVSNFLPHHLSVLPVISEVNQLELHPGYMQEAALLYAQHKGMEVQAWSPLGRGDSLSLPYILSFAEKYGKTPAQICIRYLMQRNIVPIVKSSTKERMKSNLDILDFQLTQEEIWMLDTLPQSTWRGEHPDLNIPTKRIVQKD